MSILQDNLNTIKETASELADVINQIAKMNGSDAEIGECTGFADYPKLLRKATSATSGIVTVFAYRISDVDPGIPDTDGSFDFVSNTYKAPENGNKSDDIKMTDSDTVWMSQATFASNSDTDSKIVGSWSRPIKISSPHPKSISEFIQTVYFRSSSEIPPQKPIGNGDIILTEESQAAGGLKINLGISKTYPYIGSSMRTREDSGGSTYSTPILHAYYPQDGKDGESAKLTRTAFAFTSTALRSDKPNTPKGGYWNISTNALTLPEGGSESPNTTDEKKYSGLSTAVFSSDKPDSPQGTEPSCVTGEDGVDGTDGSTSEFIYALLPAVEDYTTLVSTMNTKGYSLEISAADTVPNFILNGEPIGTSIKINRNDNTSFTVILTDSPIGIDDTYNKIEIYGTRTKTSSGSGGNWVGPMYGSVGGENGMDGDGIEYIFTASNDETCDILPPVYADLVVNDPAEAERFQQREYVPEGGFDNDDDWKGLDAEVPFLFCSSRKQYTTDDGKKMWGEFSAPKIGGHYGKDGNGAYTSFAFCISKEDLSKYTVTGGYYGDSLKNLVTEDANGKEVDIKGHDTLNSTPKFDETIGMINKFFNGSENESLREWVGPNKMADSEHFQVEFNCPVEGDSKSYYDGKGLISLQAFKELNDVEYTSQEELESEGRKYVYNNGGGLGTDGGSGAVYMATARCINNIGEDWSINKIQGESGDTTQFIFILTNGESPANPTPADLSGEYQKDDFKPAAGSFEPKTVSETSPVCGVSQRLRKNGKGEAYSNPVAGSMYAKGNVHLEIEQDVIGIPVESDGIVDKDYKDFIINKLFLYDNGKLVTNGVGTALINDDSADFKIDSVLTSIPTDTSTCGFYGTTLYLGREFLNRYVNDDKLIVECRVEYNGVPYAKSFTINKSTNIYELEIPKNVLVLDSNGAFKDSVLEVTPVKWVENKFAPVRKGYIEYILTPESGNPIKAGYNVNDETAEISLLGYTNIQSIRINYKESSTSNVLTYEHVGTVRDGKDALNKFKSTIFCRTNADIGSEKYRPKGGSYEDPFPTSGYTVPDKLSNGSMSTTTNNTGSDGIPPYDEADPKQIGSSTKWFVSDNSQEDEWSIPVLIQDTNDVDIGGSDSDVATPGNPDEPLLGAIGYDGDDAYGNNITHNPIWMAMRRQINGTGSPGVVSKVKGEKGDKGDKGDKGEPGEPGVNGGFGPMARYSIGNVNPPVLYYDRDGAEEAGYDGYDIVEHNGCYYLCNVLHEPSVAHEPGMDTAYGTLSSHFDFITAKSAAIQDLVADRIQTHKLTTVGNGARIYIHDGLMEVFGSNSDDQPNIRFGVDEVGRAILEFLDEEGNVLYDLGPTYGYRVRTTITEIERYNAKEGFYKVGVISDWNLSDRQQTETTINDVIKDRDVGTSSTLHVYEHTINGEAQADNGKYYAEQNKRNPINGVYFYKTINLGNGNSVNSGEGRYSISDIQMFNEKYPGCEVQIDINTIGTYYASTIYYIENGVLDTNNLITVFWLEK